MSVYPPAKHIDVTHFFKQPEPRQDKLFQHKMLTKPLFDYVIHVKEPLRKALSSAKSFPDILLILLYAFLFAWKIKRHIGKVTKENTIFVSTHNLIDERAELLKHHHNSHCDAMLGTAYDVALAVTGHDPYYEWLYRWHCWQVVNQYIAGRIPPLEEPPKDLKKCWRYER